jgi:hypothetical protein
MEAQVPSQKPDFARIVLGCKGLMSPSMILKSATYHNFFSQIKPSFHSPKYNN